MSVATVAARGPGIKGRRVPGKPGRFDPSEPLHMTTRKRAQTGTVNGSPSVSGSTEDEYSRRGSLDDMRPTSSYSLPSQASPETPQQAGAVDNTTSAGPLVVDDRLFEDSNTAMGAPQSPSPAPPPTSPSRKRKRQSVSPPSTPNGVSTTGATPPSVPQDHAMRQQSDDERDAVNVIAQSHFVDQEDSEDANSDSDDAGNERMAVGTGSLEMSPLVSIQVSPASSVSHAADVSPTKPLDDTADVAMADADDDLIPLTVDGDDGDDIDDQAKTDDDLRPKRKLGGKRRRIAHPVAGVEVRMRRQLETKKAFRGITRELKALLAEISQRTLDGLASSAESYTEAAEYEAVKAKLEDTLDQRLALIRGQHKLDQELLEQTLRSQQQVRRTACDGVCQNAQDAALDRLQHDFLALAREAQLYDNVTANITEDEDDVVPRPKRVAYRFKRGGVIDSVYESRSRHALDTERSVDELERRLRMRNMLQNFNNEGADDEEMTEAPFAFMNSTTRASTVARNEEAANFSMLAAAAEKAERIANIPVVRNEDATGLQLLGELCTRPSITAFAQGSAKTNGELERRTQRSTPRLAPQPMMSPPTNPAIAVEMSPRAREIFRERFEAGTMPPPLTPRQAQGETDAPVGSPFVTAHGQHSHPSPATHPERPNGFSSLAAKPVEGDGRPNRSPKRSPVLTRNDGNVHDVPRSPALQGREEPQRSPQRPRLWFEDMEVITGIGDRRPRSVDERPAEPLTRASQLPPRPSPVGPLLTDPQRRPENREYPWSILHNRPLAFGRPSSPNAANHLSMASRSPLFDNPSSAVSGPSEPLRLRAASMSVKDEQRSESGQPRDKAPLDVRFHQPKHTKTNKAERGGESRRAKQRRKKELEKLNAAQASTPPKTDGPSPAGPPLMPQGPLLRPWEVPTPQQHPVPTRPTSFMPPPAYAPHHGLPQPPGPMPSPRPFDHEHRQHEQHQQHRNSYPPLASLPLGWNGPPPPSPLYAIPQQPPLPPPPSYHPPPPGTEDYQRRPHPPGSEDYHRRPPPLGVEEYHRRPSGPPALYHQPPPMTPPSYSTAGSYGSQYGGAPIAPMPDPRYHPPGFRPGPHNHPPAFAQQRGPEPSPRRRAQSETHLRTNSWRQYEPPGSRR